MWLVGFIGLVGLEGVVRVIIVAARLRDRVELAKAEPPLPGGGMDTPQLGSGGSSRPVDCCAAEMGNV